MNTSLKITSICVSCDNCRLLCPENAIFTQEGHYSIDPWTCTLCSICSLICPVDAIKLTEQANLDE
ncbi:MAG: 4Fe-4S binding protein [Halobacteriovoraceae bacterium]|nr:4Fe-4S binding protein [Halobacteriovoraceae bacterium]